MYEGAALFTHIHVLGLESNRYGSLGPSPKSCKVHRRTYHEDEQHMHGTLVLWYSLTASSSTCELLMGIWHESPAQQLQCHEALFCQGGYTSFIGSNIPSSWTALSAEGLVKLYTPPAHPVWRIQRQRKAFQTPFDGVLQHEVAPLRSSPDSSTLYLDWSYITNSMLGTIKKLPRRRVPTLPTLSAHDQLVPTASPWTRQHEKEKESAHKELATAVYELWATSVTYLM